MKKSNLAIIHSEADLSPNDERYDHLDSLWSNFQELKPLQQRALMLILQGNSISATAKELQIERNTVYNWMQDDNFNECLNLWQKRLMLEVYSYQKSIYQKALKSLEIMLTNPSDDLEQYFEIVKFAINAFKPKNKTV